MRYITVKLTEDQGYALIQALDSEIELNRPIGLSSAEEKAQEAFLERTRVKLAQALVTTQAKSL